MRHVFLIFIVLILNSFSVKSQFIEKPKNADGSIYGSSIYVSPQAQKKEKRPIQFSGVVVTADSLKPIPFTNIAVRSKLRGTISDFYGFFSFVALEGDTIDFSSLGYKPASFVIPDTLTTSKYSLIQVMKSDTIYLSETVIYPWPTPEQFKHAFVKMVIPEDDYDRALKNLSYLKMRELLANMPMDGSMNYNNFIQKQTSRLYYAGQLPPNNLLNPFAWAQFIKAWKEGKFKQK